MVEGVISRRRQKYPEADCLGGVPSDITAGGKILGVVLNRADAYAFPYAQYGQYYGSYDPNARAAQRIRQMQRALDRCRAVRCGLSHMIWFIARLYR